jgi:hypothetical protein
MAMSKMDFNQLQSMTVSLDASDRACQHQISDLRRLMDSACDQGDISIREWRMLLEKVALVQGQIRMR